MKKTQEIKYKDEIWERILNSKYEISNYGRVRRFYKYKYRYLKTFRKGSIQVIKLHIDEKGKDYNVAKNLFISRQTVSDYCNKRVENPMYDLYWGDELIDKEGGNR